VEKNVLVEKPCFFSLNDYEAALKKSTEKNLVVQINFQRRFDKLYLAAREAVHSLLADISHKTVTNNLTAKDPVPHENDPFKYLHNSVVHDIDTAVWLAYPFTKASISSITFSSEFTLHLNLLFEKEDGRILPVNITFMKGNNSYVNKVEILTAITKKVFEEDFSGDVFFDRYREAYIHGWKQFLSSIQGAEKTNSLADPTFHFTFQLLDQALQFCHNHIAPKKL